MGPKPKLCVFCGHMDDDEFHRDEDNFTTRCPEAGEIERFPERVYLREL